MGIIGDLFPRLLIAIVVGVHVGLAHQASRQYIPYRVKAVLRSFVFLGLPVPVLVLWRTRGLSIR